MRLVVTMKQVLEALNQFEPTYEEAALFGVEALPYLKTLVRSSQPMLASKAAAMASMIQDEQSIEVLMEAALSKFRQVRVAAAYGSSNLKFSGVEKVLDVLNADADENIRRIAKESIILRSKDRKRIKRNEGKKP